MFATLHRGGSWARTVSTSIPGAPPPSLQAQCSQLVLEGESIPAHQPSCFSNREALPALTEGLGRRLRGQGAPLRLVLGEMKTQARNATPAGGACEGGRRSWATNRGGGGGGGGPGAGPASGAGDVVQGYRGPSTAAEVQGRTGKHVAQPVLRLLKDARTARRCCRVSKP